MDGGISMKRSFFRRYAFVLLALFCALAVAAGCMLKKEKKNGQPEFKVSRGPVVEAVYGIGTLTARKSFQLKISVPETISQIFVNEGDRVQKNDPLIIAGV